MCQECFDKHKEYQRTANTSGTCDWCKQEVVARRETRDYEEGLNGPVYLVCSQCRKRRDDLAAAELDHDNYGGYEEE